ncbi:hypothetical protein N7505_005127 [Penicillium chrysogenum]|uniref:Uncharacterized protein n=1 Tax=Penicillium chrysogenum TaxID=5076 RepID=A0ABQ8WHW6_PENCH|nr:hypothetical protein N7505_005127 [Penicillium chrysogenum]
MHKQVSTKHDRNITKTKTVEEEEEEEEEDDEDEDEDEDQVQRRKVLARNVKVTGPTITIQWETPHTLY